MEELSMSAPPKLARRRISHDKRLIIHLRGIMKCRNRNPLLLELAKRSADMTEKLMRAVQYDRYGGGASALKQVKVSVPSPKKDEVLVKVEACSINPVDWKYQKGVARPIFPRKFPHIPGYDIAGEVADVGPGVVSFKPGDKVVGYLEIGSAGGLAEFVIAKVSLIVPRPPEVSIVEAASLPVAALTAHQALTKVAGINLDGSGPQKSILVTAASGGVGHFAVQLAKLGNAHVTATCGARNIDFVKSLGADEVIDYKTPEGATLNSPSGRKYDAVVHCATDIPWSTFEPNLSPTGIVIDLTPGPAAIMTYVVKKLSLSKKQLMPMVVGVKKENLSYVVDLVKEGKVKVKIDSTYPLNKVEEAWAKSMDGHATGKIVVEI